jgi:sporulation protein YlmC with PRC-barrel domain
MNNATHATTLSGVVAASLLAAVTPVFGADTTLSHDNSKAWRTEVLPSDRTLGHVERANKLVGSEVLTSDNQRFGKIDNIIIDLESGRILYAVIGSGGFLGAGEQRIAVPPMLFTQVPTGSSAIQLRVDKTKAHERTKVHIGQ